MAEKSGADLPEQWTHTPRKVLRFQPGSRIADLDTDTSPGFDGSRQDAEAVLADRSERFAGLQEMLYANGKGGDRRSVLLVLQGMDTAGKGGIVEHVIGAGSPMGIRYTGFGKPTEEERAHHYLWRINKALPPAGHIGVFDRSHYEDVLVVRVHNLVPPAEWEQRYDEINAFESELVDSGMTLVKVAMFVSLDEQKKRLAERLERPDKYWKYNPGDLDERKLWPAYQEAYQAVLDRTSTEHAPWYVLPCDKKWYARLAVTELLIEALKDMNMSWPTADFDVEAEKKKLAGL
ncbi:MAG TPA: polyphosphate kinase 2 family protein [Mycobacterium sp.]|uniref:polyphosphate kinase 2 family protein n=1 Tax=Mycolicibacterium sp. TaxID=2320850 RepID=UPI0025EBB390|nr:polyphosphate kinase 2 family protein [Mycolicibacterium sp.]HPX36448.1 polyphosphate kinase 2 family protein [Mycobacterium sp.]HQC77075.1 polyphosphate kinase 2 family protein [Mycobacterium sp.]